MKKAVLILSALGFAGRCVEQRRVFASGRSHPRSRCKADRFCAANDNAGIDRRPARFRAAQAIAPVNSDLKSGLDALSDNDPLQALSIRDRMGRGTLDRHILTWAIAVSGQKGVPSTEIAVRGAGIAGMARAREATGLLRARSLR